MLTQVSGLNSTPRRRIVAQRNEKGAFTTRDELRKVTGFGPKTFEQAAGFLRIRGGANPLDASSVHPERYALVEKMAADLGVDVATLLRDGAARAKIDLGKYVSDTVGLPTLRDIVKELEKSSAATRAKKFETFSFADDVNDNEGPSRRRHAPPRHRHQRLPPSAPSWTSAPTRTAFVHTPQLVPTSSSRARPKSWKADRWKVSVTVMEKWTPRAKRIALSMKTNPQRDRARRARSGHLATPLAQNKPLRQTRSRYSPAPHHLRRRLRQQPLRQFPRVAGG